VLASDIRDYTGGRYESKNRLDSSDVWNASLSKAIEAGSTQNYCVLPLLNYKTSRKTDGCWEGPKAMKMDGAAFQMTDRVYFHTPDNGIKVPNISINAVYEANIKWPSGKRCPWTWVFCP
jgi:hypothetical protein